MGKRKPSKKKIVTKITGLQDQYELHQNKVKANPTSLAIEHWRKEKEAFLTRINFLLNKMKGG
jgi:hypothetical protein